MQRRLLKWAMFMVFQEIKLVFNLDELIDKENPVWAIDAFVESLRLADTGIKEYNKRNPGQQPYEDLLKLFIYGDFNKIRSSR